MAWTISDASALNTLLDWITKNPDRATGPVSPQQAFIAAQTMLKGANAKLSAGWTPAQLAERWPTLPVTATVDGGGVVHCGSCDSVEFQYDENVPSTRTMRSNEDLTLIFHGTAREYDGDDDPGVVCVECGTPAELPSGVELDWS